MMAMVSPKFRRLRNIERGKAEDQRPQDVKYVPFFGEIREQEHCQELKAEGVA